jgi:D-alanyl-D-alanine carboxypeptidase
MKNVILPVFLLLMTILSCEQTDQSFSPDLSCNTPTYNQQHPLGPKIQAALDSFVKEGLPGVAVAIKDSRGTWVGVSGKAKLEDNTPMQTCMVQHAYSVTKTYLATTVLRLRDQGRLNLDDKISKWLPENIAKRLTRADEVTVRMLLNHTAGYREFHESIFRLSDFLNQPTRVWSREALLAYVIDKPLLFEPGSDWAYSNTHYLLLTFIIEKVSGKDHAQVIKEEIFDPLQLKNSFYKLQKGYPDALPLPNHYWDRFSNGVLENCTQSNLNIACHSGYGEDGIVASPLDFVNFMDALANGRILSARSWQDMQQWVQGQQSKEPDYGLGLVWVNFAGGEHEFGHYGGGIGGQCSLVYLPKQQISVYTSVNVGRESGGRFAYLSSILVNRIPEMLAKL